MYDHPTSDVADAPPVLAVNESLARIYFANEDPLGKRIIYNGVTREIVGVVGDVKHSALDEEAKPEIYLTMAQAPWPFMSLAVRTSGDPMRMLAQVREQKINGIVQPSSVSLNIPGFIMEAMAAQRIPTMFENGYFVEHGGLASYGPDNYASGWQAARLVDKILKGTTPREIPVEVSTQLKFVINLKTAKQIGLTIPPNVLARADKVIK